MLEHNQLTVSHKDATEAAGAAGFGWVGGRVGGTGLLMMLSPLLMMPPLLLPVKIAMTT